MEIINYFERERKGEKTNTASIRQHNLEGYLQGKSGSLRHSVPLFPLPAETVMFGSSPWPVLAYIYIYEVSCAVTVDAVWSIQSTSKRGVCKLFLRNHSCVQICNLTESKQGGGGGQQLHRSEHWRHICSVMTKGTHSSALSPTHKPTSS